MFHEPTCGCVYSIVGDYFLYECSRHAAQRAKREVLKKKTPAAKKKRPTRKPKA